VQHRRLLIYSDAHPLGATMQVRVVCPLDECGYQTVDAADYHRCPARLRDLIGHGVDAVVVHRAMRKRCTIYPALLAAARAHRRPVIYDLDDLLFGVHDGHPDHAFYQARALHALKPLVDADLVVASTPPLAGHVSAFHDHVLTAPNRLPERSWRPVCQRVLREGRESRGEQLTIGYIGSRTHRADLMQVEPAVLALLRRYRGRVRFLSVGVPLSPGLRRIRFAREIPPPRAVRRDYPRFVRFAEDLPIDIGIAPLENNPFNRAKSDLKFQEYAALGVPGVYADLEPYAKRVRPGVTGLLAEGLSEWVEHLSRLVESPRLRRHIGAQAAGEILRGWDSCCDASTWEAILRRAEGVVRGDRRASAQQRIAPVVDQIFSYQAEMERRLHRSLRYHVVRGLARLRRRLAS